MDATDALDMFASKFYLELEEQRRLLHDNKLVSQTCLYLEKRLFILKAQLHKDIIIQLENDNRMLDEEIRSYHGNKPEGTSETTTSRG